MRRILLLIIIVFLAGCKTSSDMVSSAGYFDTGGKTTYQDKDWNLEFYDNCGFPDASSVQWVTEGKETFLRFTLKNKQVGGCRSDPIVRHGAPFWERAELKQANILRKDDTNYVLILRVRFKKGFIYNRESFLQIHQNVPGCHVSPILMLKFESGYFKEIDVKKIIDKWIDLRLEFNLEKERFRLKFFNEQIIIGGNPVESCGEPYLKFGIYRPGDEGATGERISVVDFDKIQLVEKKKK